MQQAHLTAWQVHAPWPKRSQIEQDLRLSRGVAALFEDEVLRAHVAMRGGTVLHKAHLAPATRYSEDIDLVLTKAMDPKVLERHLIRVLAPALGKPAPSVIRDAWLALRNVMRPSRILSVKFQFVPLGLTRPETIKVDVNLNEDKSLYPLVDVALQSMDDDGDLVTANVRSYDINEMLGTKTRALLQRHQGRDLYDLWHAWTCGQSGSTPYVVDTQKAMHAFVCYLDNEKTRMALPEAETLLDARLRNASFRSDMVALLRPGAAAYDVDVAGALVRSAYFAHLPPE